MESGAAPRVSGTAAPGVAVSGTVLLEIVVSGAAVSGTVLLGIVAPGVAMFGAAVPGSVVSARDGVTRTHRNAGRVQHPPKCFFLGAVSPVAT